MNVSGKSVQAAAAFFKVKPENILVVHDDLDLPLGMVRVKKGGGHAAIMALEILVQNLATIMVE